MTSARPMRPTCAIGETASRDIRWPLEQSYADHVIPRDHLDRLTPPELLSIDQLRAMGLALMRHGPPVGWMGALLLVEANRLDVPPKR